MSKNTPAKHATAKKTIEPEADTVNTVENNDVATDAGLSATKQADNAEAKAAKKADKKDHNPNRLENPHAVGMTLDQANAVVKKYGDFKGKETPNDLAQAREVIKRAKA